MKTDHQFINEKATATLTKALGVERQVEPIKKTEEEVSRKDRPGEVGIATIDNSLKSLQKKQRGCS